MKRRASIDDDSGSEVGAPVAKKSKSGPSSSRISDIHKDDDGNPFWQLPKSRRVTVSEFKKATYVNIREYYEKDGKVLPGKKGISLSLDQYREFLKAIPSINAELRRITGQSFNDPDDNSLPSTKANRSSKAPSKSNIETTSDEDDA
ncbi:hypothetical protein SAPIO_CDS2719 [Scedosporium apiospermum]|uniref:Transcriptional coactivator p15 (PC4) C-terminal domain-containing protein n=1 Tax=Pseudallescheria apiosperma TaxID=563466 RepID=A0A084GD33_PSEDA|nr:uncharacterized protein SAPIO_CDS2719 [Scedosporium apiospermum]KEZ45245.1 hypothetical protein SAPIO_CDS2719 [Scedosporium apiospermum]